MIPVISLLYHSVRTNRSNCIVHAICQLSHSAPSARLVSLLFPLLRKLPLAPLSPPLTVTPHACFPCNFRTSRSPIVTPTLISQAAQPDPSITYGLSILRRSCIGYMCLLMSKLSGACRHRRHPLVWLKSLNFFSHRVALASLYPFLR